MRCDTPASSWTEAFSLFQLYLQESFQTLKNWVKELRQHGPPNIVVAIAGNKCDLSDARWTWRTDHKYLHMFSHCYKIHLWFFMNPQRSVREGCQGLCRLHPCYLCGNQCQERHQHQRSVHRDKWVQHVAPLTSHTLSPWRRFQSFAHPNSMFLAESLFTWEGKKNKTRLLHS